MSDYHQSAFKKRKKTPGPQLSIIESPKRYANPLHKRLAKIEKLYETASGDKKRGITPQYVRQARLLKQGASLIARIERIEAVNKAVRKILRPKPKPQTPDTTILETPGIDLIEIPDEEQFINNAKRQIDDGGI
jgi:hypothetical protein